MPEIAQLYGPDETERADTIPLFPEIDSHHSDRSAISHAFVQSQVDCAVIDRMHQRSQESLLNQEGRILRPLQHHHNAGRIQQYISEQCRLVLPVYNQEKDIGNTLHYLQDSLHIPSEHIIASSCSTDGSNDIIAQHGVELVDQYAFLENALDVQRFLELMRADRLQQLRGKGLTMFAGHLQRVLTGQAAQPDTFAIQVDTDIQNVGTHENGWDPVTYFADHLQKNPAIDAMKAAKNGRNNQPMHIFFNQLPTVHPVGRRYKNEVGMDLWILTGEYGWKSEYTENLRWATGYAIETVLAMSQTDLGMNRKQVEIPQPRKDGQNLLTKETVMYTDIQGTATAIVRTGKALHDLSLTDIATINQDRSDQSNDPDYAPWVAIEKDENPGPGGIPNRPTPIQFSRLIPDMKTLIQEGIVRT
jgi:hypothetical protein